MLPDPVVPGAVLAAATARALGALRSPSDPYEDASCSGEGSSDGDASMDDDAVLPASDDDWLGQVATELPDRAGYTAVAAAPPTGTPQAPHAAVSTAASVYVSVYVPLTHDDQLGGPARMQPDRAGYAAPLPCGGELAFSTGPWPLVDDCTPGRADSVMSAGDAKVPATTAAVPMEVDQGATWQASSLSPPLVLRVGGKRRRLNAADDEDNNEDEAGSPTPALRLSAASASPASVLSVYAHNAPRFTCTLCAYTASSFASLRRHRDSRHRRIGFTDRFSAGCACGTPFTSRLAAANHANACASLSDTPSATALAAGDLSPTAIAVKTTATVAGLPTRLPLPDSSVLAVSPPHASTTADKLQVSRWSPPLPRPLIASRVASHLAKASAPRWGPPLPRSVVVSRIADRLLPPELLEEEETKADDSSLQAPGTLRYSSAMITRHSSTNRSWQSWSTRGGECRLQPSSTARWARCSPAISRSTRRSLSCSRLRRASWTFGCPATAFGLATTSGGGTAGSTANANIVAPQGEHLVGLGGPAAHIAGDGTTINWSYDRQGTTHVGSRSPQTQVDTDTLLFMTCILANLISRGEVTNW
ncbi:unnamed protein product [Peronospora destructor]|uniref:C2H2-type domain-containing protein n=1 Tax=Peronospora destructor TaxID=86335 RepID=A0AAV0UC01_9STRA|nr:unnamed protein product [Peronospora destructor]